MLINKLIQLFLVGSQFAGIIYFFISGKVFPQGAIVFGFYIIAVFIGLWAILSMNTHTLNVFPEVRKNATLTRKGPYQFIRHPMYTAVITLLSGMLLNDFSFTRLIVLCLVTLDLMLKIYVEEDILRAKYPLYNEYASKTKKLIPFIY